MKEFKTFERALKYVAKHMPVFNKDMPKPTLMHSIRTGFYLFENNYPIHVCVAGVLHDLVEDTDVTAEDISAEFGMKVGELVALNTREKGDKEYITKMAESEEALIVCAAESIDGFQYYISLGDEKEILYCKGKMKKLLAAKKESYTDPIFDYAAHLVAETEKLEEKDRQF